MSYSSSKHLKLLSNWEIHIQHSKHLDVSKMTV